MYKEINYRVIYHLPGNNCFNQNLLGKYIVVALHFLYCKLVVFDGIYDCVFEQTCQYFDIIFHSDYNYTVYSGNF